MFEIITASVLPAAEVFFGNIKEGVVFDYFLARRSGLGRLLYLVAFLFVIITVQLGIIAKQAAQISKLRARVAYLERSSLMGMFGKAGDFISGLMGKSRPQDRRRGVSSTRPAPSAAPTFTWLTGAYRRFLVAVAPGVREARSAAGDVWRLWRAGLTQVVQEREQQKPSPSKKVVVQVSRSGSSYRNVGSGQREWVGSNSSGLPPRSSDKWGRP